MRNSRPDFWTRFLDSLFTDRRPKGRRAKARASASGRLCLAIEPLEDRRLLSVAMGFEDVGTVLAAESYWNGSGGEGGFGTGGLFYNNNYDPTWGSWDGWSYSNTTDTTTPGYTNQYSAYAGGGAAGSPTYGVAYRGFGSPPAVELTQDTAGLAFESLKITNTTYAALAMLNGDGFSKKFGGPDGTDPDWFLLTIEGKDAGGSSVGTVDFYLADYRFADDSQDYIVDQWTEVDVSSLVGATKLEFTWTSSDVGPYGINTPAYCALDNVTLVEVGDVTVTLTGTEGDDTFTYVRGTTHVVTLNGVRYDYDPAVVSTINFEGLGGDDTIRITGGTGNETANLEVGSVDVFGPDYEVHAADVEVVRVYGGGGDNDTAFLYGSAGNDRFYGRQPYSYLKGAGFFSYASGFHLVEADVTGGGDTSSDRAYLYDSPGSDTFHGDPHSSRIVLSSGVENKATGFDVVKAYASGGADHDEAFLTGSAGDDRFYSYEVYGYLKGGGFYNWASRFDYVEANVISGGDTSSDRAYLYDSSGSDTLHGDPLTSRIVLSSGVENRAIGFDVVKAFAGGGADDDTAYLTGSAGDDRFFGFSTYSYLKGDGFYNYAAGFDHVEADVTEGGDTGFDRAYLYDSPGDDTFTGQINYGELSGPGAGFMIRATAFDAGRAVAEDRPDADTADLYAGTVWRASGDWETINYDLGAGEAGATDFELGFAPWIVKRQQPEAATSGGDNETGEVDLASLDYLFGRLGVWP